MSAAKKTAKKTRKGRLTLALLAEEFSRMQRKVTGLYQFKNDLQTQLDRLHAKLSEFKTFQQGRIAELETRFVQLEGRFDNSAMLQRQRIETLEERVEKIDKGAKDFLESARTMFQDIKSSKLSDALRGDMDCVVREYLKKRERLVNEIFQERRVGIQSKIEQFRTELRHLRRELGLPHKSKWRW